MTGDGAAGRAPRPGRRGELGSGREGLSSPRTGAVCLPQMQEKAKEIYMTFLSSKASSQVNVEGQSRLNEKILEEPHPLMFQKLQDQVTRPSCLHCDWKPMCLRSRARGGGSVAGKAQRPGMPGSGFNPRRLPHAGVLWSTHRVNRQGDLFSRRRSEGRLGLFEASTLRKHPVIPAEGRRRQKILESEHKDSECPGTWGCFLCANVQTSSPTPGGPVP